MMNEKCADYHPNACRNSLKNKTCSYKECRLYHLSGTKTIYVPKRKNSRETSKNNGNGAESFISKNKFSALNLNF